MIEETLPFNIQAEMAVVGGMFIEPAMIPAVLEIVGEEDFYRDAHRRLFATMVVLWEESIPIDTVTLTDTLKVSGDLDAVGGMVYLSEILEASPSAANIEYHARIVAQDAMRRRLIESGRQIIALAKEAGNEDAEHLLAEAAQLVNASSRTQQKGGLIPLKELLQEEMVRWDNLPREAEKPSGLRTGLKALDDKLGGLDPGDLVIVAARPSMGKSAFAVNTIAASAALRQLKTVAVFSVETPRNKVVTRLAASEALVDMSMARRRGGFTDEEAERLVRASSVLNTHRLLIDHTPFLTVSQMRVRCRKLEAQQGPVGLVVVDYIQLMSHPRAKDKREEVSMIGQGLKRLAQEFDCVVVALSQLSRAVEARPDKRPMISDLRESGTLEQDADVILLLYRPEYYFGPTIDVKVPGQKGTTQQDVRGYAEVIIGKARDGATGVAGCNFEGRYTRFSDR